jgi:hypothetical protein
VERRKSLEEILGLGKYLLTGEGISPINGYLCPTAMIAIWEEGFLWFRRKRRLRLHWTRYDAGSELTGV